MGYGWRETHTTEDEIQFINEMAQSDLKAVNRTRAAFGLARTDNAGLLMTYRGVLEKRSNLCQMDLAAVLAHIDRTINLIDAKAAAA